MVEGVRTSPDPASGHRLDRFDAQVATLGDPLHEVVVDQVRLGLDLGMLLGRERRVDRPGVGIGVGTHRI